MVGLQITSRLCCKQIAEGLEEKLNKLWFTEFSQNFIGQKIEKCAKQFLINTFNANFKFQIRQFSV